MPQAPFDLSRDRQQRTPTAGTSPSCELEDVGNLVEFVSKQLAGRLAATMYVLSGLLVMVLSPLLPAPSGFNQVGVAAVGLVAMMVGVIFWFLPWRRWRRSVTLWLTPIALILIAVHNYLSGTSPYPYSLFFVVVFT